MANLAASAVSLYPTNPGEAEYFPLGLDNRGIITRRLKLNFASGAAGGATNQITASVLGFDKLLESGSLWDATASKAYATAIDPVNNILLVIGGATNLAVDIPATSVATYVTVTGTVKAPSA